MLGRRRHDKRASKYFHFTLPGLDPPSLFANKAVRWEFKFDSIHMHHSNPFWLIQEQFLICSGMKKFPRRCRVKMIEDTVDPLPFVMSGETLFLLLPVAD